MPIYEYKCGICGKEFEELVRKVESAIHCPQCDSENCTRKFSVFGFSAGSRFVSSSGNCSCSGCSPTPGQCKGCK